MQLSFPSGKSVAMTFKLGIAGTATAPTSVSVVLERDGKSLSYEAKQDGEDWSAIIDKPDATFGAGDVKVSVNVLINNRLFTPLKSAGTIVGETQSAEPVPDVVTEVPPEVTAPEAVAAEVPEQVVPEPLTVAVEPAETTEAKKKKVGDLLTKAQTDVNKKKTPKIEPIRLGLLKTMEPAQQASEQVVEEAPVQTQPKRVFNIKKTKVIYQ